MIKKPEQFKRRGRRRRWSTREEIRILHETKIKLQVCSSVESASISGFSLSLSLFLVIASYCLKLLWKESDGKYVEEEETRHERTQDGELIWKEKKRWMCCNWKKKWKLKSIKAISSPAAAALYVCHALRRLSFHILFSCELPLFILSSSRGRLEVIQTKELLSKWMECHLPVGYESVLQNVRPEKRRWRREETFWTKKKRGRASDTRRESQRKGNALFKSIPNETERNRYFFSLNILSLVSFLVILVYPVSPVFLPKECERSRGRSRGEKKKKKNETKPFLLTKSIVNPEQIFSSRLSSVKNPNFSCFSPRETQSEKRERGETRGKTMNRETVLCVTLISMYDLLSIHLLIERLSNRHLLLGHCLFPDWRPETEIQVLVKKQDQRQETATWETGTGPEQIKFLSVFLV